MTRHKSKVLEDVVALRHTRRRGGNKCSGFQYHRPARHVYLANSRISKLTPKNGHSTAMIAYTNLALC